MLSKILIIAGLYFVGFLISLFILCVVDPHEAEEEHMKKSVFWPIYWFIVVPGILLIALTIRAAEETVEWRNRRAIRRRAEKAKAIEAAEQSERFM